MCSLSAQKVDALPAAPDTDGKGIAFASCRYSSTPRCLAPKLINSRHICSIVCLQNVPLGCTARGRSVAVREGQGEEVAFSSYQSSHASPSPRCTFALSNLGVQEEAT